MTTLPAHDNPLVRLVRGEITVEEYVEDLKRRVDEESRQLSKPGRRRASLKIRRGPCNG